jgi:preprotein translocase subunit SecA
MLHVDMSITVNDDKIWMDDQSKLRGICGEVRSLIDADWDVLVLAHFESELQKVSAALRSASIPHKQYSLFDESLWSANSGGEFGTVWVGLARTFQPLRYGSTSKRDRKLSIIVAEHHPLRDRDEKVREAAQTLPVDTHVCIHAALTDPLLIHFGSEQIGGLVRQLGMDEETCLSNQMINTAIRRSQEKIAKLVTTEIPTLSAKDWFKYNLPQR